MWQLQTTEHTNQNNNQSILIKGGGNQWHGSDTNYYFKGKEETKNRGMTEIEGVRGLSKLVN